MEISINYRRAEEVLGTILRNYQEKRFPFTMPNAHLPQIPENMPKTLARGSRDHANFLFCLCYYMRGGMESDRACRLLGKLYDIHPHIFQPEISQAYQPSELESILFEAGLKCKGKDAARFWPENARRLHQLYNNHPALIFSNIASWEEAVGRIKNHKDPKNPDHGFLGFQEKMVSMLTYYLMDAGFVDRFNFPVPVDIHVCRICISHGLITATGLGPDEDHYKKPVLDKIREMFMWHYATFGSDPLQFTDAVWIWSRTMCKNHPGNNSTVGKNRQGRKTEVTPENVVWSPRQTRSYLRYCANCDIRESCGWNIASADYYVGGKIVKRSPREDPNFLFSVTELKNSNPDFTPNFFKEEATPTEETQPCDNQFTLFPPPPTRPS
jgi:hypothetical protein